MAYINITGDSDGDLHNAAMHNSKFGAIASVLNGNVDEQNLKYPQATFVMSFSGGVGSQPVASVLSEGYVKVNSVTSAVIDTNSHTNGASETNILMPSWIKMNGACTLVNAQLHYVAENINKNNNCTAIVQTASSLTGSYATIATVSSLDQYNAGTPLIKEANVTISSSGISASQYLRCGWINATAAGNGPGYPPKCTFTLTFKAYHVA
tara:strand:+ start:2845 stop:3471 length:627 start_codon:yes stop_codon:yes gene_type:complete